MKYVHHVYHVHSILIPDDTNEDQLWILSYRKCEDEDCIKNIPKDEKFHYESQ